MNEVISLRLCYNTYNLYGHVSEVALNGSLCALQVLESDLGTLRWSARRIIDDTPSREFNYFKLLPLLPLGPFSPYMISKSVQSWLML